MRCSYSGKKTALIVILLIALILVGIAIREHTKNAPMEHNENFNGIQADSQGVSVSEVQIVVGSYKLTFSGKIPDGIGFRTRDTDEILSDVEFYTIIGETQVPVFSMNLENDRGDIVTRYTDETGIAVPIAFEMYSLPENLDEAAKGLFYNAQDMVNTLVTSLKLELVREINDAIQIDEQIDEYVIGGYTLSFDKIRTDAVQIEVDEEKQAIVFSTFLAERIELFRISVNVDEGDIVMYVADKTGNLIPVSFTVNSLPEGLDETDSLSFYRAQETINDVIQTIHILK